MGFRLVPTSMTLNDFERRNSLIILTYRPIARAVNRRRNLLAGRLDAKRPQVELASDVRTQ